MRLAAIVVLLVLLLPLLAVRKSDAGPLWPPGEWQAAWIWVEGLAPGAPRAYFRKVIELKAPVKRAWYQGSGDDSYTLFVNGEQVLDSGFWWATTRTAEITSQLRQGLNCLAAEVRNSAQPGGFLGQFEILLEDGTFLRVNTDSSWQAAAEPATGWLEATVASPKGFGKSEVLGPPPQAPWGKLPCYFFGEPEQAQVEQFDVAFDAESRLLSLHLKLTRPLHHPLQFTLGLQQHVLHSLDLPPTAGGTEYVYKQKLSGALGGEFSIDLAALETAFRLPGGALAGRLVHTLEVQVTDEAHGLKTARFYRKEGTPIIEIEGERLFPLMYTISPSVQARYVSEMAQAGFRLYSFGMPWERLQPGKTERAFHLLKGRLDTLLFNAPEGYAILRTPAYVSDWYRKVGLEAEPTSELARYATGVGWISDHFGGTRYPSMASELWQKAAESDLRALVRFLEQTPVGNRVIGLQVAAGIYGEWHYWGSQYLPDVSAPMQRAFVQYLEHKYKTRQRLQAAWCDPKADFETVTLPGLEARLHSDEGVFLDPARSQRLIDYYECFHKVQADCLVRFCRAIKEESHGKLLTGAFWGYTSNMGWMQEGQQFPIGEVLASGVVDFLASPHSYEDRRLGQSGAHRALEGTIRQHGKLFFDEGDDRTHLIQQPGLTWAHNDWESCQLLWREFGNAICRQNGVWYFDMSGGWFDTPAMLQALAKIQRAADFASTRPQRDLAQVAVVCDLQSTNYVANWYSKRDPVTFPLLNGQWEQLYRMGVPFDLYDLPEFLAKDFPAHRYKLVVLLNTFHVGTEALPKLLQRLHQAQAVLTFYAPGYVTDEGLSLQQASQVAGMRLVKLPGPLQAPTVRLLQAPHTRWDLQGLLQPVFGVDDPDAFVLGRYEGLDAAAFARKQQGETTFWYAAIPVVPAKVLQQLASSAGVRLVAPEGEILALDEPFVMLHTPSAGEKILELGAKAQAVLDLRTLQVLPVESGKLKLHLKQYETFCGYYGSRHDVARARRTLEARAP